MLDDPNNHQSFEPMHKVIHVGIFGDNVIKPGNQFHMALFVPLDPLVAEALHVIFFIAKMDNDILVQRFQRTADLVFILTLVGKVDDLVGKGYQMLMFVIDLEMADMVFNLPY
jgi:hypothetical protein